MKFVYFDLTFNAHEHIHWRPSSQISIVVSMRRTSPISNAIIEYVRSLYREDVIPLHRPVFEANERDYIIQCIDSNFVSSVGSRVIEFEEKVAEFCGTSHSVATVNGTAALHVALMVCGVERDTEVLTQALTFVATANAISYVGANPVFIDVDTDTMGMSPTSLKCWLESNTTVERGQRVNTKTRARISACVPMHTFGLPLRIEQLAIVCREYGIPLIEDTAESLGSFIGGRHTGTFGDVATFSFNGNKIITTGGGGMIVTNNPELAQRAKHITTTAKQPHPYEFFHDEIGYNYRLPNLNAALGVAQMEVLPETLKIKSEIAAGYLELSENNVATYVEGIADTQPNHWLNAICLKSREQRDEVLKSTNEQGVMTRPIWRLMNELPMYQRCQNDGLEKSMWLVDRVINVPSSVPESQFFRLKS